MSRDDATSPPTEIAGDEELVAAFERVAPHLPTLLGRDLAVRVRRDPEAAGGSGLHIRNAQGETLGAVELELDDAEAAHDELDEASSELARLELLDRQLLLRRAPVRETLDGLLDVLAERLPRVRTAVLLAPPGQSEMNVEAHRGLPREALGLPLDRSSGPIEQTLRVGSPHAYPADRFHLDPEHAPEVGQVTVVPLLPTTHAAQPDRETPPGGVILVAPPAQTPLHDRDLQFLRRLGIHGALLLDNARLLERLRSSEETYRTMVERAHLGMALVDQHGVMHHTNRPMREILGGDVHAEADVFNYVHPEDRSTVWSHLRKSAEERLEPMDVRILGHLGEVPVRASATPIQEADGRITGYVVVARDRTREQALEEERRAMEGRVQQAEKLSAIGKFVAGIAHELNNPLTVVVGYAELLTETAELPAHLGASVEQVLAHARRCARIVDDLLKFAHQERSEPEDLHLPTVVREALAATELERDEDVEVELSHPEQLPPIRGNAHALSQVLTNILDNAREAVRMQQGARRVRVHIRSEGGRQLVEVEDTGPGIPEPARIFDPFYTTKPIGRGTGLGLSTAYGIVRDHGGDLRAENRDEGGARLTVLLPEREEADEELLALPGLGGHRGEEGMPQPEQHARVLVVDDEPAILELTRETLRSFCSVTTAETADEALKLLAESDYDLILTDLRLPEGRTGADFFETVQERWPETAEHIAFMTGDTISRASQAFLDRTERACIRKPFRVDELITFVDALTAPADPGAEDGPAGEP